MRKHRVTMMLAGAALVASALAAAANDARVEDVVAQHLEWLASVDNFRASIQAVPVSRGVDSVSAARDREMRGDLVVDYRTRSAVFRDEETGTLPKGISRRFVVRDRGKIVGEITNDKRKAGFPAAQALMSRATFPDGADDLFVRGDTVEATMQRLRFLGEPTVELGPGATGLRLRLKRNVLHDITDVVVRTLIVTQQPAADAKLLDRSPQEPELPTELVFWFDADGRMDAVDILGLPQGDLTVAITYEQINSPEDELAGALQPPHTSGNDLATLHSGASSPNPLAVAQDLYLDRWPAYALSFGLAAFAAVLVLRLRRSAAAA